MNLVKETTITSNLFSTSIYILYTVIYLYNLYNHIYIYIVVIKQCKPMRNLLWY